MPETVAQHFVMYGAREAIASGLSHIESHVDALERAVEENPALAFDLARTVIESTCRTILSDRGVPFANDDDLPKIFRVVSQNLPFLPASASGNIEARKSLMQTISGLSTAVQGVAELRNACGFASHGSDKPRPRLETVQAILVAEAADAIVGFFYRVHLQDRAIPAAGTVAIENDNEFDTYIDDLHPSTRIFEEEFLASRILFELAPEPYRLYLAEYNQAEENEQKEDNQAVLPPEAQEATAPAPPTDEVQN